MEERYRLAGFFFQKPVKGYSELTRLIGGRFQDLLLGDPSSRRETYRDSSIKTLISTAESRFFISVRIKTEFGLDANKLNLYEYYLLIEQLDKMSRTNGRISSH